LTADGAPYTGPAAQRRRLALLALLAAAGRRGMSRDKVLGYLWPDADEEQGRQGLYQALHVIRRSFGPTVIIGGTTSLQLNPESVTSDVADFTDAIAARGYERAVDAYGGAFLDGLALDGSSEFDRWVDAERARYARDYATALGALAAAAAGRRDFLGAVRWWRRLAAAEPVSTSSAVGLIEALVAAGDRAGALQSAQVHVSLVRSELETEPDAAVTSWIARLKAGGGVPAATSSTGILAGTSGVMGGGGGGGGGGAGVGPGTQGTALGGGSGGGDWRISGGLSAPAAAAERTRERLARALASRFIVERRLTVGSVIATYAAADVRDRSPVELHVVHPHVAAHVSAENFIDIVRRAAALDDARLLRMLDGGATEDIVYFVTAPAGGVTVRDRLARGGALPIPEAVAVSQAVASGLATLHMHNLTHGDLRPKHVHLMPPDAVLSGYAVPQALVPVASDNMAATDTAVTIGAPAYMSPEQLADGARPNARSDIYSFGCIVYEVLTGEPPFGAAGGSAAAARKLTQPAPSPRAARESVSEGMDAIVRTCLARVPADRFPSGVELAEALSRLG
jgi:DNA-binding SARP family transcriptional activator